MGDHYKLKVSGIEDQGSIGVHFVHVKSENPKAKPLLLVHGWPGSFLEFLSISKTLKTNYHLVIPWVLILKLLRRHFSVPAEKLLSRSIPGFAFSDPPKKASKAVGELPWGR